MKKGGEWPSPRVGRTPSVCHYAEAHLPCELGSVPVGRHFVSDALIHWGVGEGDPAYALSDAVVLASDELLANAARFCAGSVVVKLVGHAESICVSVSDDNPEFIDLSPAVVDLDAESGRGLLIVAALAERWGQHYAGSGKEVWFRLSVPRGSALGDGCTEASGRSGPGPERLN